MTYEEKVEILRQGGRQNLLVELSYFDKKYDQTLRHVEPYEFKGDGVYAFCHLRQGIRLFKIEQMENVRLTSEPFVPRWPIKVWFNKSSY